MVAVKPVYQAAKVRKFWARAWRVWARKASRANARAAEEDWEGEDPVAGLEALAARREAQTAEWVAAAAGARGRAAVEAAGSAAPAAMAVWEAVQAATEEVEASSSPGGFRTPSNRADRRQIRYRP